LGRNRARREQSRASCNSSRCIAPETKSISGTRNKSNGGAVSRNNTGCLCAGPGKNAVSLVSLRNHQLGRRPTHPSKRIAELLSSCAAGVHSARSCAGEKATGVIGIKCIVWESSAPLPLNFGIDQNRPGHGRSGALAMDARVTSRRKRYAGHPETSLRDTETNPDWHCAPALADDLKPINARGRWKPSSLVILAGFIVLALLAIPLRLTGGAYDPYYDQPGYRRTGPEMLAVS